MAVFRKFVVWQGSHGGTSLCAARRRTRVPPFDFRQEKEEILDQRKEGFYVG